MTIRGIQSRVANPTDLGHAWIRWKPHIQGRHLPIRGYYPDISQVPAGIIPAGSLERRDYSWARRFFMNNAVPGLRTLDRVAMTQYEHSHPNAVRQKSCVIDEMAHLRLEWRCSLPDDRTWVPEGHYSFNQTKKDWHNCVSWAIERWNETVGSRYILPSLIPPRVRAFVPLLADNMEGEP